MAERTGRVGPAALMLGGVAAVAVVLGGYALVQFGSSGSGPGGSDAGARDGAGADGSAALEAAPPGRESNQPLTDILLREAQEAAEPETQDASPAVPGTAETGAEGAPAADDASERTAALSPGTEADATAEADASAGTEADPVTAAEAAAADAGADADAKAETETETAAAPEPLSGADPEQADPEQQAEASAAAADAAAEQGAEQAADAAGALVLDAPELGLVRVDRDGDVVIAGQAQPGARVSVLLDGDVLEEIVVPQDGRFVALTSIVPSEQARVISLLAARDGQESASESSFILAPVTAAAAEAAEPAPETEMAEITAAQSEEAQPEAAGDQVAAMPADAPAETASGGVTTPDETAEAAVAGAAGTGAGAAADAETASEAASVTAPEVAAAPETAAPDPAADQGTAVAVLRAGADGIEVVQPAPLPDPALIGEVALDAISYSEAGSVELAGRARPQSLVRIYIDNAPAGEAAAEGSGRWSGSLAGVAPGIYTLRVDEVEAETGAVLSRIETPFKREAPEDLALPAAEETPAGHVPLVQAVTVQKGDTLWAISQKNYGSGFLYVRLFEANKDAIRNPDLIYPGQVFSIPD